MNISIIGAGYVGLTTSACLAELGHKVTVIDTDVARVEQLRGGDVPIYEPNLDGLIHRNIKAGRLSFTTSVEEVAGADAVFVAVGTPSREDGSVDLSFVEAAVRQSAAFLTDGAVVVLKSTVPPGTTRAMAKAIREEAPGLVFSAASNPEFLREGSAVSDFMHPDRIVVGTMDDAGLDALQRVYFPFGQRNVPFIATTPENSELIKYASNAFLALKIGYINEIADLCEHLGGDVTTVAEGMGLDRRIGPSFLNAGPGFGGSCFPKDTRALAATARQVGIKQPLIELLVSRNEERMQAIATRITDELARQKRNRDNVTVAILGIAFKAKTNDVREAASLTVIPLLQKAGVHVRAYDPQAMVTAASLLEDVEWCDCPYSAAHEADLIVVLTEWPSFKTLNLKKLAQGMRGQALIDYRNLFEPDEVTTSGLDYVSVGRQRAESKHA